VSRLSIVSLRDLYEVTLNPKNVPLIARRGEWPALQIFLSCVNRTLSSLPSEPSNSWREPPYLTRLEFVDGSTQWTMTQMPNGEWVSAPTKQRRGRRERADSAFARAEASAQSTACGRNLFVVDSPRSDWPRNWLPLHTESRRSLPGRSGCPLGTGPAEFTTGRQSSFLATSRGSRTP
jgi:hypothetical protein